MTAKLLLETLLVLVLGVVAAVTYYLLLHREKPWQPQRPAEHAVAEDREHALTHDGRQRRYLVHVPKDHDGKRSLPVVLGFHGGGGKAESFRLVSRLNEAADQHGFLVVYPDGTGRRAGTHTFNAGRCCGYAMQESVDDVGFVRALLNELPRNYPIDPKRIYATGLSNGAMLCYRLACELSDRIAAIGPVAGTMAVEGPQPSRPVPVIHFHGKQDKFAPYDGGKGPLGGHPHEAVRDTIAWWLKANSCREQPVEVKEEKEYICRRYLSPEGAKGAPVTLYILLEGGHTWPGGVDTTSHLGTGKLIETVDATLLMWRFFEQFALP